MKRDNQITGNIGLFYVCHQLSLKGWNVLPTSRNTRGIDIIAYKDSAPVLIQIKTLSKKTNVPLGKSVDNMMDAFWIIINNAITDAPNVFILHSDEVKKLAKYDSSWLKCADYDKDKYRNQWGRLEQSP